MQFDDWIEQAYSLGASDLHLESETPAVVRVRGELQPLGAACRRTLLQPRRMRSGEGWAQFLQRGSADLALSLGSLRCRVSFYRTCAASASR